MSLRLCPPEGTPAPVDRSVVSLGRAQCPQDGFSVPGATSVSPGRPAVPPHIWEARTRPVAPQGPWLPSRLWVPGGRTPQRKKL